MAASTGAKRVQVQQRLSEVRHGGKTVRIVPPAMPAVDIDEARTGWTTSGATSGGATGKRRHKDATRPSKSAELSLFDFMSVYNAAPMDRINWMKKGLGADYIAAFAEQLRTSKDQLMKTLDLPRATIDRKAKANQNLSTEQAERVIGLSKLIGQVQTMVEQSGDPSGFNAAQWVGQWLERANPALGGQRPAELMDTVAGQEVVGGVLAKMQSGAYA